VAGRARPDAIAEDVECNILRCADISEHVMHELDLGLAVEQRLGRDGRLVPRP
jgi:hypothetical protein